MVDLVFRGGRGEVALQYDDVLELGLAEHLEMLRRRWRCGGGVAVAAAEEGGVRCECFEGENASRHSFSKFGFAETE